ncbi:MAG: hypothetical protein V4556_04250 [Bacteroidota bacterium]
MKKYILIIFFFLPLIGIAQNIKIKKNEVFVNDSPYCKIIGKTGIGAAFNSEGFSITSLEGKELIQVKKEPGNYHLVFMEDGAKMNIRKPIASLSGQKHFIKTMYNSNLLENDEINVTNREFFLEKIDEASVEDREIAQTSANGTYNVVERNTSVPIQIYENSIDQDGVSIATFMTSDEETPDGTLKSVITFYLINGTKAAKLDVENKDVSNNNLVTFKNNNLVTLKELKGDMYSDKFQNVKTTALWLISRGYL